MAVVPIDPVSMPREQRMNCVIVLQKFTTFVSQAIRNLNGHKQEFQVLQKQRQDVNKSYRKCQISVPIHLSIVNAIRLRPLNCVIITDTLPYL